MQSPRPASVRCQRQHSRGELPRWLLGDIRCVTVTPGAGHDRLVARAVGRSGLRARFEVVLRPVLCLKQSRLLIGGMAATG